MERKKAEEPSMVLAFPINLYLKRPNNPPKILARASEKPKTKIPNWKDRISFCDKNTIAEIKTPKG